LFVASLNDCAKTKATWPRAGRRVAFLGFAGFGRVGPEVEKLFEDCVGALDAVHGRNPNTRLVSSKQSHEILRAVLGQCFKRPKSGEEVERKVFERRVRDQPSAARRTLQAPPTNLSVTVRIGGLLPAVLPFTFGIVVFEDGGCEGG
jgi:hypothetical protein